MRSSYTKSPSTVNTHPLPQASEKLQKCNIVINCRSSWLSMSLRSETICITGYLGHQSSIILSELELIVESESGLFQQDCFQERIICCNDLEKVTPVNKERYLSFLIQARVTNLAGHMSITHAISVLPSHLKLHKIKT